MSYTVLPKKGLSRAQVEAAIAEYAPIHAATSDTGFFSTPAAATANVLYTGLITWGAQIPFELSTIYLPLGATVADGTHVDVGVYSYNGTDLTAKWHAGDTIINAADATTAKAFAAPAGIEVVPWADYLCFSTSGTPHIPRYNGYAANNSPVKRFFTKAAVWSGGLPETIAAPTVTATGILLIAEAR
jgi:hypothetical protein